MGGRLVPALLDAGYHVRATSRSLHKLANRSWADHPNVELAAVNLLDANSLSQACANCDHIFYLVHSMVPGVPDFAATDRQAAHNLVQATQTHTPQSIIYLSGLGTKDDLASKHLQSRYEVEDILKQSPAPLIIFRAAMIIGSGSASFEILRYLVERLPIMVTPKWIKTRCQPIAIRNVIHYLVHSIEHNELHHRSLDIGGQDIVTYEELMKIYQEEAGLYRRAIIRVPYFTPRLSSYWIHLVTPVPAAIAQPLAEGLRNEVICLNQDIQSIIPQELLSCRQAIHYALEKIESDQVLSHWTDSGTLPPFEWTYEGDPDWAGGTHFTDERECVIAANPSQVWSRIQAIGGSQGWYHANLLWRLRGKIDQVFGGVGLRRGRRTKQHIAVGDALDFWRVLSVTPNQHLLLVAEMKLPGKATLEFELQTINDRQTKLIQRARFKPQGLWGLLYWYSVAPLHHYVFGGMVRKIKNHCEQD